MAEEKWCPAHTFIKPYNENADGMVKFSHKNEIDCLMQNVMEFGKFLINIYQKLDSTPNTIVIWIG